MSNTAEPKIRLLILVPSLECGGTEKFAVQVCEYINTRRFEVTLAVLNNKRPFYVVKNPVVSLIDLKVKRVRTSLFAIRRTVKQQRPDIIFSLSNHLNLYLAIYRRMLPKGIKLIGRESSIPSILNKRSKYLFIYDWLMKKFYHRFDGMVCQSVDMQQDLIQHFGLPKIKTHVIYNMAEEVQNHHLIYPSQRENSAIPTFLTVARLSEEKGIDRLIKAVSLLPFSFQYHIIGEGDQRQALEGLIIQLGLTAKVLMPGNKENPFEGLTDADLFLMGSVVEGFPNVLLEAGVLGIPVVAFDAPGGIKEIIRNGENGLLVTSNDIASYSEAIERSLKYKYDRKNIMAVTKKRFPREAMITGMEQLFLSLLAKP